MVFGCKLHFISLFHNTLRHFFDVFLEIIYHFETINLSMLLFCKLTTSTRTAPAEANFQKKNKVLFSGKIVDGLTGYYLHAVYQLFNLRQKPSKPYFHLTGQKGPLLAYIPHYLRFILRQTFCVTILLFSVDRKKPRQTIFFDGALTESLTELNSLIFLSLYYFPSNRQKKVSKVYKDFMRVFDRPFYPFNL